MTDTADLPFGEGRWTRGGRATASGQMGVRRKCALVGPGPRRGRATELVELLASPARPELLQDHAHHAISESRRTRSGNPCGQRVQHPARWGCRGPAELGKRRPTTATAVKECRRRTFCERNCPVISVREWRTTQFPGKRLIIGSSDTYRRIAAGDGRHHPERLRDLARRRRSNPPRERERVLPPGAMEVAVPGPGSTPLHTTWHAWRHHIDLCRTSAALCPA
ncbi:hypothetical protein GCM10009609_45470 [Pseudonocardia aurantiaca]